MKSIFLVTVFTALASASTYIKPQVRFQSYEEPATPVVFHSNNYDVPSVRTTPLRVESSYASPAPARTLDYSTPKQVASYAEPAERFVNPEPVRIEINSNAGYEAPAPVLRAYDAPVTRLADVEPVRIEINSNQGYEAPLLKSNYESPTPVLRAYEAPATRFADVEPVRVEISSNHGYDETPVLKSNYEYPALKSSYEEVPVPAHQAYQVPATRLTEVEPVRVEINSNAGYDTYESPKSNYEVPVRQTYEAAPVARLADVEPIRVEINSNSGYEAPVLKSDYHQHLHSYHHVPAIRIADVEPVHVDYEAPTPAFRSYEAPVVRSYEAPKSRHVDVEPVRVEISSHNDYEAPVPLRHSYEAPSPVVRAYDTVPATRFDVEPVRVEITSDHGYEAPLLKSSYEAPAPAYQSYEAPTRFADAEPVRVEISSHNTPVLKSNYGYEAPAPVRSYEAPAPIVTRLAKVEPVPVRFGYNDYAAPTPVVRATTASYETPTLTRTTAY